MNTSPLPRFAAILLLGGANVFAQSVPPLQQFLIEREIKGAGAMTATQLREASQQSNRVLRVLGPDIQWVHSYVAGDKTTACTTHPAKP